MTRRFAAVGGLRRAIRDGRGKGLGGVSQQPPLPASAIEYWHSELQCTPASWVGQLLGRAMTGAGAPIVAADPGFFGGRVVAQSSVTGPKYWLGVFASIAATGTRPWLYVIGRLRSTVESTAVLVSAAATGGFGLANLVLVSPNVVVGFNDGATQVGSPAADIVVHRWKYGADGVNANLIQDSAAYATAYAGALPQDCIAVAAGISAAGNYPCTGSIAFILVCASRPTVGELAALDAWAQSYWSIPPQTPPLPASAVEYWHSELGVSLVSGEVDAWAGQLRGTIANATGPTARPAYGADGTLFNGRKVVQCAGATAKGLRNAGSANLITIGQRPWLFSVFRYRVVGGTSSVIDFGIANAVNSHSLAFAVNNFLGFFQNSATGIPDVQSTVVFGTSPRVVMAWSDGTNANINVSGTLTTAPFVGAMTTNTTDLGIARTAGGAWPTDTTHAFHLLCSSKPTATEISALAAWAQAYWGAS